MKKSSRSAEIALSAIACALATVFLTVGVLVPSLLVTGYLLAEFSLMIPLSKGYYWGAALAHIGACFLSLAFGAFAVFWKVLPFLLFFGLHPLVNSLQKKFSWNRILSFLLKAVWFDVTLFLCWRFTYEMAFPLEWMNTYILPLILIGGTVFFAGFDYMIFLCQRSVNSVLKKIGR